MKTKEFKNTKGITLISLIVSIVVLLILAGISIVTLTGENRTNKQNYNCKKQNNINRNARRDKPRMYECIRRKSTKWDIKYSNKYG